MKKIFIFLLILGFVGGDIFAQNPPDNNTNQQAEPTTKLEGIEAKQAAERDYRQSFAKVLIDFTKIDPEYDTDTEINFAYLNTFDLPQEEVDKLKTTFSPSNWEIYPQSSIYIPNVLVNSFTKPVEVNAGKHAGEIVLGIRLHFPNYQNVKMSALIVPPFVPNVYSNEFVGKGALKNVGPVRSAYITIYALNNSEKIDIVTTDSSGNDFTYAFGQLNFTGWRTLEWVNPRYIEKPRAADIKELPLYPSSEFNRRLKGIQITKPNQNKTIDMVTYVRDIQLTYDQAIDEALLLDIDNEAVWNIIEQTASIRDRVQFRRSLGRRYLKYLEGRKKYDYGSSNPANAQQVAPAPPTQ